MRKSVGHLFFTKLLALSVLVAPGLTYAQYFDYQDYGDVVATFRKTGAAQGNYEFIVKLGYFTNFLQVAAGSTINITQYSPSQLSDAFPDNFANLQWEVSAGFAGDSATQFGPWLFPEATIWYTLPATNASAQSTPPARLLKAACQAVRQQMLSMGDGASTISFDLGTTNQDNNTVLVREPISYPDNIVTTFLGDRSDPTLGDFYGVGFHYSVENKTPNPFVANSRTDFYQVTPTGYLDPVSGQTTGNGYFVGYFLLKPDGTMSFTRASAAAPPPPRPRIVSIVRTNGASNISFTTTNGATYKLYYTDSAGLSTPITNWLSLPGTLVGDGKTNSLSDSTTTAMRFYSVGAH